MCQRRVQRLSLVHAQSDADDVLRFRKQLRDGPAEQQGNHGAGAAVVVEVEPHEFGLGDGDAVYGVPVIVLKARHGDQVQRVGHLFMLFGDREVVSARQGVKPLLLGDRVPGQADALRLQLDVIPFGAVVIEQRPHNLVRAGSVRQAVEHVQDDPVVLPAEGDHVKIGIRRIQRHAAQRMRDDDGPMVFREDVLAVLLPQFDAEIGVSLHGGIHGVPQDARVDQVAQADPDPDFIGALLGRCIKRTQFRKQLLFHLSLRRPAFFLALPRDHHTTKMASLQYG